MYFKIFSKLAGTIFAVERLEPEKEIPIVFG